MDPYTFVSCMKITTPSSIRPRAAERGARGLIFAFGPGTLNSLGGLIIHVYKGHKGSDPKQPDCFHLITCNRGLNIENLVS